MGMCVCILVGGMGSRLGPLTAQIPKPLLLVGGRPFLDHLLDNLCGYSVTNVILLAGHNGSQVAKYVETAADRYPFKINVVIEPTPRGTGGALWQAFEHLPNDFVLLNGDSYFGINIQELYRTHITKRYIATVALRRVRDVSRFGSVTLEGTTIDSFGEKDRCGEGIINGGVYVLSKRIFRLIDKNSSLERDVLPNLVPLGLMGGLESNSHFRDIGVPMDFELAQGEFSNGLLRSVAFFDRDNTLVKDHSYTYRPKDLAWIDGAKDAIKLLNSLNFLVCIVSNQAGIARGIFEEDDSKRFFLLMQEELAEHGAHVDMNVFCPHHPDGKVESYRMVCRCRKPLPGLLEKVSKKIRIDLPRSFLVGDKEIDVKAAQAFGIKGHRFEGGSLLRFVEDVLGSNS